jgi:hypothetical protein
MSDKGAVLKGFRYDQKKPSEGDFLHLFPFSGMSLIPDALKEGCKIALKTGSIAFS